MSTETIQLVNSSVTTPQEQWVQPSQTEELDDVALYYLWQKDEQRKEIARWFQLEETATFEEIEYHVNKILDWAERHRELERKRLLLAKFAAGHVVPNQENLRPELSALITERYFNDLYPTRTVYYDPDSGKHYSTVV